LTATNHEMFAAVRNDFLGFGQRPTREGKYGESYKCQRASPRFVYSHNLR